MRAVDLESPHAREARAAQVEVDEQGLLARLGARDGERARGDRLAFARLRGHDQHGLRDRLVARRVQQVAEAGHGLGELRVLVLGDELRHLFALLAADVRQHGQHLEGEAPLDVGERHDRVLEVVEHEHEQQPEAEGQHGAGREDDQRVRQDRPRGNLRGPSRTDDFVVLLGGDAVLVLLHEKVLVDFAGDLLLLLQLLQAGVGLDDLLSDDRDLLVQVVAFRLERLQLVLVRHQLALGRRQRALDGFAEFSRNRLQLALFRHHGRMLRRVPRLERRQLHLHALQFRVGPPDIRRTRHLGRQLAEVLRVLLRRLQHLHPLVRRRHALLVLQDVGRRRLETLVEDCALRLEVVDLVLGAELEQTGGEIVVDALLLLDLLVDFRHGLVAALLVLLVREGLDRLRVGVGECCGELRRLGPDGDRDQSRMAHELEHGASQHLHEVLVRHRGVGVVGAVLLEDFRENRLGTPVGLPRVEDFRVVRAVVVHVVSDHADAVALVAARVHRELALRLVYRGGDAVDGKCRHEADEEEHKHRDPALGDHAKHAAQRDRAHDGLGVLARRLPAVCAAVVVGRAAAAPVVHRRLRRPIVDWRLLGRAVIEGLLPVCG